MTTTVPVFDAILPDNPEAGITAVSFVLNPAIQHPFVALADEPQTVRLHLSQEPMRQIVTGPALLPDAPVFRLSADNKPFYIRFSAATIEQLARRFMGSANLKATTDEHAIALQGNQVVESWLVTEPARDKSAALGLTVPAGTWMLSVHIPDATYWNEQILSGQRTGFSIEALLDLAEPAALSAAPATPAQHVSKPRKRGLLARLMRAIFLSIEKVVDGPEIEIDDQTGEVFAIDADGNRTEALPDGTYTLQSGETLIVAGGKQADAPAAEAQPVQQAAEVEQAAEEAPAEPVANPEMDTLRAELEQLRQLVEQMQAANQSLEATNTELQTQLAALPAARPVKLAATPEPELTPAQIRLARAKALRG